MKVSVNWLKQYVEISDDIDVLTQKIAAQLAEIEDIVDMRDWYDGIIIATIETAKEHPSADKLGVYGVNTGSEVVQVCAGDKTLKVGDRVGYIPPGSKVPLSLAEGDPFTIGARELRGEESNGMLGSAKELLMGDDHEGVLRLDPSAHTAEDGTAFAPLFGLDDVIIEVENKALTHRPDAFGIIGFAREIAGIFGVQMQSPQWLFDATELPVGGTELQLDVRNEAPDGCYRFTAVAMSGISITHSPEWIQSYLFRLGVKSINNVVDITNYLMLLTGQPLHAFDYDKVAKLSQGTPTLIVRHASEGEKLEVLDGRTLALSAQNLVIATDTTAVSVAGAIGGTQTEVDESTQNIIIEVGNFDLYNIRKTSMQHGIFTDAVTRFIRGQDPASCAPVSSEAVRMVMELAGGDVSSVRADSFDAPRDIRTIVVTAARVNQLLGSQLSGSQMKTLLENVELEVSLRDDELAVVAPTWRNDLHIAEDIIEEIGRLNGYSALEARLPMRDLQAVRLSPLESEKRRLRNEFVSAGANELLTYSFVPDALLEQSNQSPQDAYRIRNALRPELQRVRTSLMPSLLQGAYANIRRGFSEFAVFEIGKSHNRNQIVDDLPKENHGLAFMYVADAKTAESKKGSAYYVASYYARHILGSRIVSFVDDAEAADLPPYLAIAIAAYEPGRRAVILVGDTPVGVIGEYARSTSKALKIPKYAAGFEMDIESLIETQIEGFSYRPLSRFPSVEQDITFSTKASVAFSELHTAIGAAAESTDTVSIEVSAKEIFMPESEDIKKTTFRLKYQKSDATLTTDQATDMTQAIVDSVVKTIPGTTA